MHFGPERYVLHIKSCRGECVGRHIKCVENRRCQIVLYPHSSVFFASLYSGHVRPELAQNSKRIQASSYALLEQARQTIRQDKSFSVVLSQVEFGSSQQQ